MKMKKSSLPAALSALCVLAVGVGSFAAIRRSMNTVAQEDEIGRVTVVWEQTQTSAVQAETPVTGVFGRRETETAEKKETAETTFPSTSAKQGDAALPLGTDMVKDFSNDLPVYNATLKDWRVHNGVDFGGKAGDEVKAAKGGKVISVVKDDAWGTVAEIAVSDTVTLRYCGLSEKTTVAKGDTVAAGQTVGFLGTVPCEGADGSHLHFEVIENGKYIDPLTFLNRSGADD